MASVESLKHFAEPPNVVDPITLLESRQNHEVSTLTNTPNLPSAIKGAPSVKIGNIIDNASLKGSQPVTGLMAVPIAISSSSKLPAESPSISRLEHPKPTRDGSATTHNIEPEERKLGPDSGSPAPRSDPKRLSLAAVVNSIRRSGEWLSLGQNNVDSPPRGLEDQLKAAMKESNESHRKFLPQDQLDKIITKTVVDNELSKLRNLLRKYARSWKQLTSVPIEGRKPDRNGKGHVGAKSDSILSKYHQPPKELQEKSYRKIFAILLFIRRPSRLWSFVEDGVCDADLPLIKVPRKKGPEGRFHLRREKDPRTPLRCLMKWREGTIYDFAETQWIVLAPQFRKPNGKDVLHIRLQPKQPLPFTSWRPMPRGGYGQVYRAKVHYSHHAFDKDEVPYNVVAVKKLFSRDEEAFKKESEILKSLSSKNHRDDHLITLLATYEQSNIYYLVFPWAQKDLEGFWKLKPGPHTGDQDMAKWLVDQCEGIAKALSKIHRYETRSDTTTVYRGPRPRNSRGESGFEPSDLLLFGRHGDIKPRNILWFPGSGNCEHGVLKITDFGIAHFKINDTGPTVEPPNSRTYRSPECDLDPRRLSTLCDVWALGCVYLVFITWYFGGLHEVEKFAKKRRADGHFWHNAANDHFFNVEQDEQGVFKAKVKNTVIRKIDEIRSHGKCTKLFGDLLDLIQEKMLVVQEERTSSLSVPGQELSRRKSSRNIASGLSGIQVKCERNSDYVAKVISLPDD